MTVLAANEHHAEARRACNSRKTRPAELTLRRFARAGGAAVRTIESFGLHRDLILTNVTQTVSLLSLTS